MGKVVDMLHSKQISSPTGKLKWTRATVDHLLSNGKYVAVVGLEKFLDVQFEKAARCNIDYDKDGAPRKDTRYVSPAVVQIQFVFYNSESYATMTLRGDCVAKKLKLVDMYGIGVMLEYLVAEDNLT